MGLSQSCPAQYDKEREKLCKLKDPGNACEIASTSELAVSNATAYSCIYLSLIHI